MAGVDKFAGLLGRILIAQLFLLAGIAKIGGYAATQQYMSAKGVPGGLLPLVILLEIGGAVAVAVGWQTRLAALALAVFCILAALLFHLNFSDPIQSIMLKKDMAVAGAFLFIFARGAGGFSLDERRRKR